MVPQKPPQRTPTILIPQILSSRPKNMALRLTPRIKNCPSKRNSTSLYPAHGISRCQNPSCKTVSHEPYLGPHKNIRRNNHSNTGSICMHRICNITMPHSAEIPANIWWVPAQPYFRDTLHVIRCYYISGTAGLCLESKSA